MKTIKLTRDQKESLDALLDETVIGAIVEDLEIDPESPAYQRALQYLIDELQKMKSV